MTTNAKQKFPFEIVSKDGQRGVGSRLRTSVIDEMLELDPWTFDQTESGWRSLPPDLQIEALRAYVAKNLKGGKLIKSQLPGKVLSPGIIFWHLGQALALRQSGGNKEAIGWMKCSLDPEDPQWNDYAKATIAFLEDDRVSFDEHSQGENYNKSTLDRLKSGWGRTYSEAYGGATSNEQVHEGLADTSWLGESKALVARLLEGDGQPGYDAQLYRLKFSIPMHLGLGRRLKELDDAKPDSSGNQKVDLFSVVARDTDDEFTTWTYHITTALEPKKLEHRLNWLTRRSRQRAGGLEISLAAE